MGNKTIIGIDQRVMALGMARMADSMGNSFIIVVLPLYIASDQITGNFFGFSESLVTGIIIAIFGLTSSVCQPFAGWLSDRTGKRQIFVLLGLVIFTFANFSFILAENYLGLLIIRTVQGIGAALTITTSLALVSGVSKVESRGGNMGIYNSFRLVGFGTGALVSGALLEKGAYVFPHIGAVDGYIVTFCVAAGVALLSALLVALLVRDPTGIQPSTDRKIGIRVWSREPGRILDPVFALGLATFIMSTGFALLTSIEPEVNRRLSQGTFLFAVEFSTLIGALAVVQPLVGRASDRFGRKVFIVAGLICLAPTTFAEGLATEPWHMILARAFQGVSAASVFAPALALAGDLAEKGRVGAQLSILTMAFGLGISFGAIVSGYAIRFGFLAPFAFEAALALVGALLVYTQVPSSNTAMRH